MSCKNGKKSKKMLFKKLKELFTVELILKFYILMLQDHPVTPYIYYLPQSATLPSLLLELPAGNSKEL